MANNFPQRICKISSQTASSSASIAFTSGISSNFTSYLVTLRNVLPATNNVSLLLTFSTDGGSTYLSTNYSWALGKSITGTTSSTGGNSASSITIANGLSSTYYMCGDIMLFGLAQSTFVPKCYSKNCCYNTTPAPQIVTSGGLNTGTTAVNAIKFAMSSGNIASGTIALYGCQDGGFLY